MSSKKIFITDTHLGARGSSHVFRQLFREYYFDILFPYAKKHGIDEFYHGGDFFDSRNAISLADIDFIVNEFIPKLEEYGFTMVVCAGNHDVAHKNTNRINSLSLLKSSKNITIVDEDLYTEEFDNGKTLVICPWLNSENNEQLLKELKPYANKDTILLGHFEFQGCKMYANSKVCDHGLDTKDFRKFGRVLSGHFHHHSVYGNVTYLGALFHYNWMDYGDWRGFTVYDEESDEFERVENPYCLFTQLDYHEDALEMSDEEFKDACEGQFVRLVVNKDYKRVQLKDIVHKIESYSPVSLDVIDNTILVLDKNITNDPDQKVEVKEVDDFFDDYYEEAGLEGDKDELKSLFDSIKEEAEESLKDVL